MPALPLFAAALIFGMDAFIDACSSDIILLPFLRLVLLRPRLLVVVVGIPGGLLLETLLFPFILIDKGWEESDAVAFIVKMI